MIRLATCAALFSAGMMQAGVPALAASFDCAKAATPFEEAICGDADLSKADERLARTYATAIGGLRDVARDEMQADQREWLSYAQRACTADAEPLTNGSYDERGISCLTDLFTARSRVLETSRMIDGVRFYPISRYAALPDPEAEPDSAWAVAQHELSMVQIDADEGFAYAFSDVVRQEGEFMSGVFAPMGGPERIEDDASSDSSNSIVVEELAGDNRITLRANTYWYGHGAAHGNYTISFRHYLKEQGRFLEARDLFAGEGWEEALLELAVEAAKAEHGDALMLDDTKYIAEAVIDPQRWDLSDPYGLVIQFQPYEISAYAYGAPTARVNWEKLEPYLAETADAMRYGY